SHTPQWLAGADQSLLAHIVIEMAGAHAEGQWGGIVWYLVEKLHSSLHDIGNATLGGMRACSITTSLKTASPLCTTCSTSHDSHTIPRSSEEEVSTWPC